MENRKRNCRFLVSLSEKEMNRLTEQVCRTGLSRNAYIRQLLSGTQPKELPPVEYHEVLRNLRQIGNNMNQIAAKANATGLVDTAEYWKSVRWLEKEIGKIMEVLY